MLGLGLAVSLTGLLTLGAEERHGIFAGVFGFRAGEIFHALHEADAIVMLALVVTHLAGVAFESWRHRENLIAAMITGRKRGQGISTRAHAHIGALMLVIRGRKRVRFARARSIFRVTDDRRMTDKMVLRE